MRKSDEGLTEYYEKMFALSTLVVANGDKLQAQQDVFKKATGKGKSKKKGDASSIPSTPHRNESEVAAEASAEPSPSEPSKKAIFEKFNPSLYKVDDDGDSLTYEKAKRMLRRLDQMKKIRNEVIYHPELEVRIATLKRYKNSVLPSWWSTMYDRFFLHGVARWGVQRGDLICSGKILFFTLIRSVSTI